MKVIFVDSIPKDIEKNIFYISDKYKVITHKCPCGCERNVSIFIDNGWNYSINEKDQITIDPSIATGLECGSHYWVKNSKILWSNPLDREEVQARLKIIIKEREIQRVESKRFITKVRRLIQRILNIFL